MNHELQEKLLQLNAKVESYFNDCDSLIGHVDESRSWLHSREADLYWTKLPDSHASKANELISWLVEIGREIAIVAKRSVLVDEADLLDISRHTKQMRASIRLRKHYHRPAEVIHDEGNVLGISPASQGEFQPASPSEALKNYSSSSYHLMQVLQLADDEPTASRGSKENIGASHVQKYRPDTAFIMMWMDPSQPELDDVHDTVREAFEEFGIRARRADEIEHDGIITQRIIDEIKSSEFLFADLPPLSG